MESNTIPLLKNNESISGLFSHNGICFYCYIQIQLALCEITQILVRCDTYWYRLLESFHWQVTFVFASSPHYRVKFLAEKWFLLSTSSKFLKLPISFIIPFFLSAYPSVRMEKIGSHWTDFHEILYLSPFKDSVETIKFSLNSDRNNVYFTWRPIYLCDNISMNSWN
jgi:hypothetical protein